MRDAHAGSGRTDVTGFGLLGHLHRMLLASGARGHRSTPAAVPVLDGALELARQDVVPGGTKRNHEYVEPNLDWGDLSAPERFVLADAQTSGGLLIATMDADRLVAELQRRSVPHAEIGRTMSGPPGRISIHGRLTG